MLHSTNIQMLQKHSKVATLEGSFEYNTFGLSNSLFWLLGMLLNCIKRVLSMVPAGNLCIECNRSSLIFTYHTKLDLVTV